MLRKFFILVFFSASFAGISQNCGLLNNLIIPTDTRVCREDTLRFQLTDSSLLDATNTSLVYQWTSSHAWHDTTTNPFFAIPGITITPADIAGTIWVKIIDTVNSCIRYDTIVIDAFPTPEITNFLEIDTTLCFGDTLRLKRKVALNVERFHWEIFSGNIWMETIHNDSLDIIFDSTKTYTRNLRYVAVFTGHCARYFDRIRYTVHDTAFVFFAHRPIVDLGQDTIFCDDGDGFELTALNENMFLPSIYKFRWNANDRENENTFTVFYEDRGIQTVEVWSEICWDNREIDGYFVTDTIDVDFWPKAWTEPYRIMHIIDNDTSVCDRIHVVLDATAEIPNLTTYHWSGPNIDTTNISNPVRTVFPGTYRVMLRDSAGCERIFTINVREESCDPQLEMPNVFTPNNDGVNDFFRPIVLDKINDFSMRIYSRWGRMVYEFSGDPMDQAWQGWDGRNGGSNAPEGVYFWAVRYTDLYGRTHRMQGAVTLLR